MKEYKVYVKDINVGAAVQEHAFSLGYLWDGKGQVVGYHDHRFLVFERDRHIHYCKDDYAFFKYDVECEELTPEEFMRLTKEEVNERVFDIEPFDKILAKSMRGIWVIGFFERIVPKNDYKYVSMDTCYSEIIKYHSGLNKYIGTNTNLSGSWS